MDMPMMWPHGPVRTWATEALEHFVAEVERGTVIWVAADERFLTLSEAQTELLRRHRQGERDVKR